MNYLGIDIGGTAVKFGLVTDKGEVLHSNQYSVSFDQYETPILETVLNSCSLFLKKYNITQEILSGIAISATGQIDSTLGIVAGAGGNIKNWEGIKLKKAFSEKYNLPVTVINDANCVALGEKWIGTAKNYKNIIVITIGTGVGGGIIVNDQLLLGHLGFAGELGHFSIKKDGILCTCGNKGCYERYASMTALIRSVQDILPIDGYPDLTKKNLNGKIIFDMLKDKNSKITEIIDQWIDDIASGLISLTHIFNPEIIVIGGGVSVQEDLFTSRLCEKVLNATMKNFSKNLLIESATLGNNAGLIGAVYYLINQQKNKTKY